MLKLFFITEAVAFSVRRRPSQKVKVLKRHFVTLDGDLRVESQTFSEGKGVET